jgi:hypothetical protein
MAFEPTAANVAPSNTPINPADKWKAVAVKYSTYRRKYVGSDFLD